MDYIVHGILQARILEWVAFPFSRGPSQPRDQTQSPTLQVNLPAEPQGKPENTGVGSLSPLQVDPLNLGIKPGLCIASRFFTNWAIREAPFVKYPELSYIACVYESIKWTII